MADIAYGRTRARVDNWIDTKTMRPLYGVSIFHNNTWMRVAKEGQALLVASKQEAQREADRLARKMDKRNG